MKKVFLVPFKNFRAMEEISGNRRRKLRWGNDIVSKSLFFIILIVFLLSSCVPSIKRGGEKKGCEWAEEYLQYYIVQQIKVKRFEKNLPSRLVILPASVTVGFLLNYLSQLTFILPLLAPTGYTPKGTEFKALLFKKALRYTPLHGTRLDRVDESVIADANFKVGLCYYHERNYAQASAFFESLLENDYWYYLGAENLFFLLGDCYYQLGMYDRSVKNFQSFLEYCSPRDERIDLVKSRIETINALYRKGLWGLEEEHQ